LPTRASATTCAPGLASTTTCEPAPLEQAGALTADALSEYQYLGEAGQDAVIALVMRLIPDDAVRHHRLLKRIATTLRDALYWTTSPGVAVVPQHRCARPHLNAAAIGG
jgi:hypothetical protein